MLRRFLPFLLIAGLSTFFLFTVFQNVAWRRLPQSVGLGEAYGPSEEDKSNAMPDMRLSRPDAAALVPGTGFKEPKVDSHSPYPVGKTKARGSNYTRCLVLAQTRDEHTEWVEKELGDMLASGLLSKANYVVDDRSAPLHPPKNKGHEGMVYLSYIIDSYDQLADVNIFMHAHRFAWHNNQLLDTDASLMVRHLSPERVTRDGYMNLRCHWDPGCPAWMHPGATQRNVEKEEEYLLAEAWTQIFPLDPIPAVLAQPCCAQFAVSRDRIRAIPKQRYVSIRDWILRTELSDALSGRVFEYVWQFIFTASPLHCPSMSACYCDGYGVCFGGPAAFDHYFELNFERAEYMEMLRVWEEQAALIETAREQSKDGRIYEEAMLEVPRVGEDEWLRAKIAELNEEMGRRKKAAVELGRNPAQRALEAGRAWKEGDGY